MYFVDKFRIIVKEMDLFWINYGVIVMIWLLFGYYLVILWITFNKMWITYRCIDIYYII